MPPRTTRRSSISRTARAASSGRPRASRSSSTTKTDPKGRPLKIGDHVEGGGNRGKLVDIQWRAQLANKKAAWFTFDGLRGEAGYPDGTPLRNAGITDPIERQKLIIDAGPQAVDCTTRRKASFGRDSNPAYAVNFPPSGMAPNDIDTLGEMMTDDSGRLLLLGGHGNSGSFLDRLRPSAHRDLRQQRRLVRRHLRRAGDGAAGDDGGARPAAALRRRRISGLGAGRLSPLCPEVLDMITLDDVLYDLFLRTFAEHATV